MAETLGGLVDRLTILNLKLWFVQDWIHQARKMGLDEFERIPHDEIHRKVQQLAELNLDRNEVMSSIDRLLASAVTSGRAPSESRVKLA